MSLDSSAPLIILDVEGSDSKERWDERNVKFFYYDIHIFFEN